MSTPAYATTYDVVLLVNGRPAPQGSKRHVGGGRMIESSPHVGNWREDVRTAALLLGRKGPPLDGALAVRMVFTVAKPKSAPKTRRTWPASMPDLSKLIRATEDALTSAGIWKDDARVVEYDRAAKVYPGEDPEALDVPGAVIAVRRLVGTEG